jgi:ferric-dicitrate binding protein FerR (iron transport regulator)
MNEHGRELSDIDTALELLRVAGPRRDASPDREARVTAAVRAHWGRSMEVRRRRRRQWQVAAVAAAAVLVLAVTLPRIMRSVATTDLAVVEVMVGEVQIGATDPLQPPPLGAGVQQGTVVETGDDGRVALRLADGGSLRVDIGSRIVFEDPGTVRLDRGAVYIDSDPSLAGHTPLAIDTARGRVRELGTQFEVRLLPDFLRVRVREGRVTMQRIETEIEAGQQALMNADGALELSPVAPTDPGWSWLLEVAPAFELEGASAAAYLRWVERETGLELRWAEQRLAARAEGMVLHGDTTGLRPDQTLEVVLPTCGLGHKVEQGALIVSILSR